MNGIRLAFSFLTILPVAPTGEAAMSSARAWFPLVGLALGAALAGIDLVLRLGLPDIVVGALLVSALLVLTRALHTEGFLDCCDGLFGGYTPEDRLRILRDTHVGAFAVVGGAALLIVKWSLLAGAADEGRVGLLLLFPCLSRLAMLTSMCAFPYARSQGLGTAFHQQADWRLDAVGLLIAAAAAAFLLGFGGLILLGSAVMIPIAVGRWMTRRLGGMTGDAYGAVNELAEVGVLVIGAALIPALPDLFDAPVW